MTKNTQLIKKGALIIRLCNWVGEAVLSLPTLTMLAQEGYDLHLIGKRWASSLFEGHGWTIHIRPTKRAAAIAQLRQLRHDLTKGDREFSNRPNYMLFTNSFSSALEGRLAGLKPIGYSREARSLLLAHAVPYLSGLHAADNYWRIGTHLSRTPSVRPTNLGLTPSAAQMDKARALVALHQLSVDHFTILCPFSGADDASGKKQWPEFERFAATLYDRGTTIVLCPGPGEERAAKDFHPNAISLQDVDLGTYAALTSMARCTVSNDTGPAHLAAAANGYLISVLGPDGAEMWWPQGNHVSVLKKQTGWPSVDEVLQAMDKARP